MRLSFPNTRHVPAATRLAHWLATADCFVTVDTAIVTLPFEVWFQIGRLAAPSALRFAALRVAPFSAATSPQQLTLVPASMGVLVPRNPSVDNSLLTSVELLT